MVRAPFRSIFQFDVLLYIVQRRNTPLDGSRLVRALLESCRDRARVSCCPAHVESLCAIITLSCPSSVFQTPLNQMLVLGIGKRRRFSSLHDDGASFTIARRWRCAVFLRREVDAGGADHSVIALWAVLDELVALCGRLRAHLTCSYRRTLVAKRMFSENTLLKEKHILKHETDCSMRYSLFISRTSTPPMRMLPLRLRRIAESVRMVVFPPPEGRPPQ